MFQNEYFRFGSASWSSEDDLRSAGMLKGKGLQIGYWGETPLCLDTDAPSITIAGAGAGKMRDLLAMAVASNAGGRNFILDPRGEIAAVTQPFFAMRRACAYTWNPCAIAGLPQHRCNPLDILDLSNSRFHADCKFIAESLIPLSGSSNGHYFELRARDWIENLLKAIIEQSNSGSVSFPDLFRTVNLIETDRDRWADFLSAMLSSSMESVRRTAGEMVTKQQDSPKEFGAILGELYAHLNFLDDPMLQASLENPNFSLNALCDPHQPATLFVNVPIEYVALWSPVLRTMFTAAMLYKSRAPQAPRLTMIVDECGQLGRFEAVLRAFTFGRGAGVRAWALFQDTGQIIRNFGQPALQGFLGSAALRQFFGVRDYETASMISSMLGQKTLEFDDTLRQAEAQRSQFSAAMRVMNGDDPFQAMYDMRHFESASQNRTKQARPLMTPDEILAMPEDRQILFVSGKSLKPIYAERHAYWTRPGAGFLPNPYHPPLDVVTIPSRRGPRTVRVIREPVPAAFAHLPQYRDGDGIWAFIEGFRPS
jgi:type IV secretion system protein VirD4